MMAKTFGNNIAEHSSTLGTGTYFLDGPITGYRTFASDFVTNDQPYYAVRNVSETKYEYNKGANFTSGTPSSLVRNVFLSSNSNAAVSWVSEDTPLIVYIPTAGEVLEAMTSSWLAFTRNPMIKFSKWWQYNTYGANVHGEYLYDGAVDIPVGYVNVNAGVHAYFLTPSAVVSPLVQAGAPPTGYVALQQGGAVNSGYIEFKKGDNTRVGYIGYAIDRLNYQAEIGATPLHEFNGIGGVVINGPLNVTGLVTGASFLSSIDTSNYALLAGRYSAAFTRVAMNTRGNYGWEFQANGTSSLQIDVGIVRSLQTFSAPSASLTSTLNSAFNTFTLSNTSTGASATSMFTHDSGGKYVIREVKYSTNTLREYASGITTSQNDFDSHIFRDSSGASQRFTILSSGVTSWIAFAGTSAAFSSDLVASSLTTQTTTLNPSVQFNRTTNPVDQRRWQILEWSDTNFYIQPLTDAGSATLSWKFARDASTLFPGLIIAPTANFSTDVNGGSTHLTLVNYNTLAGSSSIFIQQAGAQHVRREVNLAIFGENGTTGITDRYSSFDTHVFRTYSGSVRLTLNTAGGSLTNGIFTVPTATAGTNTQQIASTAFVQTALAGAVGGSIPTGPAGGSLAGTYPNPTLASGATVPGILNVTATSGFGALEMAGPSGAYIDLKTPVGDDYDLRLQTVGTGGALISASNLDLMAGAGVMQYFIEGVSRGSTSSTGWSFGTDAGRNAKFNVNVSSQFQEQVLHYNDNLFKPIQYFRNYGITAINQGMATYYQYGIDGITGFDAGIIGIMTTDTWATTANQSTKLVVQLRHSGTTTTMMELSGANGLTVGNGVFGSTLGVGGPVGNALFRSTGGDGTLLGLFSGVTKGLRFTAETNGVHIEGVDNTGVGSFQPLYLYGTNINLGAPVTGTSATFTGTMSAPGALIQTVHLVTGATSNTSAIIPLDETIPQNTEGAEFMQMTITPKSATSKLIVEVTANAAPSTNDHVIAALFRDSVAGAVAATTDWPAAGNINQNLRLMYTQVSGTTSPIVFKVRMGTSLGAVLYFNGRSTGQLFGGACISSIFIHEIVV